jgi:hypothetical protein
MRRSGILHRGSTRSRFTSPSGSRIPNAAGLLFRWRKLFWLGVSIIVLATGNMLLTKYGPALRMASVETGASFSVSAGTFASEAKAATFAAALDASDLPILVRVRPEDGRYQVLVGPYVSTDEAERAQRKLAKWGLGESRLVVDDTMRASPLEASLFGIGDSARNSVLMVAAAGTSSLVFEMNGVPKQVEARRTSATSVEVEIGQVTDAARQSASGLQPLRLPDGVVLLRELSVESENPGSMRAHLVLPEGVESRLRLENRRVYLDLAFPKAPWRITPRASGTRAASAASAAPERPETRRVVSDAPSNYREQLDAIVARFAQIEPFLLSAAEAPEPDVLAALGHSLEDLRGSLAVLRVPAELEVTRQSMLAAVAQASNAIAPVFAGDRATSVRQAVALFEASSK